MADVADGERSCRYVCVAALARPGYMPRVFRGEAEGVVLREPAGEGGFGYDPVIGDSISGEVLRPAHAGRKERPEPPGQRVSRAGSISGRQPHPPGPRGARRRTGVPSAFTGGTARRRCTDRSTLRMACPCAGCVDEMTGRPLLDASSVPESVFPVRIQHVGPLRPPVLLERRARHGALHLHLSTGALGAVATRRRRERVVPSVPPTKAWRTRGGSTGASRRSPDGSMEGATERLPGSPSRASPLRVSEATAPKPPECGRGERGPAAPTQGG